MGKLTKSIQGKVIQFETPVLGKRKNEEYIVLTDKGKIYRRTWRDGGIYWDEIPLYDQE